MEDVITRIVQELGEDAVVTDEHDRSRYEHDWRGKLHGRARAVVRPRSVQQVATVIRICNALKTPVVPQGGNTGLCGGATADTSGRQVILSLERMSAVRQVDALGNTLTAEAGCTIAQLQASAAEAGRMFPLSFAAEGTAQIGGALSTNAGGNAVLRYGCARDLALGLEVVLASGDVLSQLKSLRKDNTGYDLKQLFIGSEGTLGIITAAVVKILPAVHSVVTAWVALPSLMAGIELLRSLQDEWGDNVTAFELVSGDALALVLSAFPTLQAPLAGHHAFHGLIDIASSGRADGFAASVELSLIAAGEQGLCLDATVARNESAAANLWRLREEISEAEKRQGLSVKHDVSVPHRHLEEFLTVASAAVAKSVPGARPLVFGHLGDGSLHFNVALPAQTGSWERSTSPDYGSGLYDIVHGLSARLGGSISAEHGLGSLKVLEAASTRSPVAHKLMHTLKAALDPHGILNPGKVL